MKISNSGLWMHVLGGVWITKLLLLIGLSAKTSLLLLIAIAIGWEVFEYFKNDVTKIYGSKKRFYLDAFQDIVGAFIAAIGVII